jgi:hypothetical protein
MAMTNIFKRAEAIFGISIEKFTKRNSSSLQRSNRGANVLRPTEELSQVVGQ